MDNVFASLNKKDSLKVLLEHYEESLHKGDHISESPRAFLPQSDNKIEEMNKKDVAEDDSYSRIVREKQSSNLQTDMGLSASYNQEKTIDRKILAMTTKIRN
jgi:hypothetical protein